MLHVGEGGAHLPLPGLVGEESPNVYDVWPVRRQTYGYLPSRSPLAGTKLYCLLTEAHVYYQLAQGCARQRGGRFEPATY